MPQGRRVTCKSQVIGARLIIWKMASPSVLPRDKLLEIAEQHDVSVTDVRLAKLLDHQDSLSHFRDEFCYPTVGKLLDNKLEEGNVFHMQNVSVFL